MVTRLLEIAGIATLVASSAFAEVEIHLRDETVLVCDSISVSRNFSYCVSEDGTKMRPVNHQEVWKVLNEGHERPPVR